VFKLRLMDFSLTDDQKELQAAFGRLFDEHASITDLRAAEPLGFSADLWQLAGKLGIPDMAGGSMTDGVPASLSQLIVIAEEYGRRLAPIPLVEALAAVRALDRAGMAPPPGIVTLALRPIAESGSAPLLAAGAIADAAVGLIGEEFVLAGLAGDGRSGWVSNLGSSPLANRELAGQHTVLASRDAAREAYDRALDDWKLLLAAALIGVAAEAHRIALAYVKERKAFGVPIGWFQTVAHRLADSITDLDGARFLVHKAAWAVDQKDETGPRLVSMAYVFAAELAERVTAEALHFHGGIGYTMEHDIQLYFRRAKCWPLALGDPRNEMSVLSTRLLGPRRTG
jgi:alkylation response protein AidB-like acyl-CoA dehydrogenase